MIVCQCPPGSSHHRHVQCPIVLRWYVSPTWGDTAIVGMRLWVPKPSGVPALEQVYLPVDAGGSVLWTRMCQQLLGDIPVGAISCMAAYAQECHAIRTSTHREED